MKMKTLNRTLIAVLISAGCTGLSYADLSNPFIDNSQNAQPSSGQNSGSQAQPTLQPTQPVYNFSQKNSTTAPLPFLVSNTGPGAGVNSSNANSSSLPAPATLGSPSNLGPGGTPPAPLGPGGIQPTPLGPGGTPPAPLGPGATTPSSAGSLLQAILNLDVDVKNTNKLNLGQWNQSIQNQAQANAMLLPTDLNFVWGQTAYQNMQQLVPGGTNQQATLQTLLTNYSQNICSAQGSAANTCQAMSSPAESAVPAALMSPQSILQVPAGLLGQTQTTFNTPYITTLLGNLQNNAASKNQNNLLAVLGAAQYALSNIAAGNQIDTTDGIDSQMNILNTAVTMPLSNTPDPVTNQTWFQQLSVASDPQLLRSVAVMLALNNYLQYQNLKAAQTQQLLESAQLVQEVRLEQAVNQFNSDEAARQANTIGQMKNILKNY